MEKIEQTWEVRNFGFLSAEFRFDVKDKPEDISRSVLECKDYPYQVARVPVGRMDLAYLLQEYGFKFAETSVKLICSLKKLNLCVEFQEIDRHIEVMSADSEDLKMIYSVIKEGVFSNDKIALDPKFSIDISGNRFYHWCRDEVESGQSSVYVVTYENKKIGFFILKKETNRTANSLLAALYDKTNSFGLGYSVLYHPIKLAHEQGYSNIKTSVSSNNISSLKLHLAVGYEISNMEYVLIKHLER